MNDKKISFVKQKMNVFLLLIGLVCLSCTIFTFFGYGLRASCIDTDHDDQLLLVINNFFSMILGEMCFFGTIAYGKLEFKYYQSVVTPAGKALFSLQILLIVFTVLAVILICTKVAREKVIYVVSGLTVVCGIASTVLALTPQSYVMFCAEDKTVFNIFDVLREFEAANIELTGAQICYAIFASIGLSAVVASAILTILNNLKNKKRR